jgi:hypothetical protein
LFTDLLTNPKVVRKFVYKSPFLSTSAGIFVDKARELTPAIPIVLLALLGIYLEKAIFA